MEHKGTVTLETERLILRRFEVTDAEDMFNNWASSERVTEFLTWQPYQSVDNASGYINYLISCYENDTHYDWVIELKENHQAIGSIGVVNMREDTEEIEVGYCISDKLWHQGIMTEALNKVVEFFFTEVEVNRIMAKHDVRNPNSGKVMQKCGLKYEGTHRQAEKNNAGICDTAVYAILKSYYTQIK